MPPDNPVLRIRQLGKHSVWVEFALAQLTSLTFDPHEGLNVNLVRGGEFSQRLICHRGRCWTSAARGWRAECQFSRTSSRRTRKRGSNPPLPPLALIP